MMKVTLKDLVAHGLNQKAGWFTYHFNNTAIEWRLGKKGLINIYHTNDIKNYIEEYLKKIEKMPHIARHKSPDRFMNLTMAIRSFECER